MNPIVISNCKKLDFFSTKLFGLNIVHHSEIKADRKKNPNNFILYFFSVENDVLQGLLYSCTRTETEMQSSCVTEQSAEFPAQKFKSLCFSWTLNSIPLPFHS